MKPSSATDEGMNQRDVNECCKYISDSLPHYATKAHEMLRRLKDCAYEGLNTPRSEIATNEEALAIARRIVDSAERTDREYPQYAAIKTDHEILARAFLRLSEVAK